MQSYLHPVFVMYGTIIIIIKIICFAGNTLVKVLENGKEIEKLKKILKMLKKIKWYWLIMFMKKDMQKYQIIKKVKDF